MPTNGLTAYATALVGVGNHFYAAGQAIKTSVTRPIILKLNDQLQVVYMQVMITSTINTQDNANSIIIESLTTNAAEPTRVYGLATYRSDTQSYMQGRYIQFYMHHLDDYTSVRPLQM